MIDHDGCDCPEARCLRAVVAALRDGPEGAAIERLFAEWHARSMRELSIAISEGRDWTTVLRPYAERTTYTDADVPDWARPGNAKLALTRQNTDSATDATTDPV